MCLDTFGKHLMKVCRFPVWKKTTSCLTTTQFSANRRKLSLKSSYHFSNSPRIRLIPWCPTMNTNSDKSTGMSDNSSSSINILCLHCRRSAVRHIRQSNAYYDRCRANIAVEERRKQALEARLIHVHFIVTGELCSAEEVMLFISGLTVEETEAYHRTHREKRMLARNCFVKE